jgi:hypothetical protein
VSEHTADGEIYYAVSFDDLTEVDLHVDVERDALARPVSPPTS